MKLLPFLMLAAIPLLACSDAGPLEPDTGLLSLSVFSGDGQEGFVNEELPDPVTVFVGKISGKATVPVKGILVNFVVTGGGGSMFAGSALTDGDGLASDYWTLGPEPGINELEARAVSADGTKLLYGTFTATATLPLGVGFGLEQFTLIPAGSFQMGDITGTGAARERPVHTVNITSPFYIQKTEVTQGQWEAVMGTNPSHFTDCGPQCPVEMVSWDDIQAFLAALNALEPGVNYRLPTEAEWEYAARAGTTGDYGGTGVLDEMGWYDANSGGQTHLVAEKQPNDWGLFDAHGNVWEWVSDWFDPNYYSVSPSDDPQGPAADAGFYHVVRGGSWRSTPYSNRSARRSYHTSPYRYSRTGFRLVRTP